MKITKEKNRKVEFLGVQEGHALIAEYEGYEINGRMRWNKAIISLSPQELGKILEIVQTRNKYE